MHASVRSKRESIGASSTQVAYIHLLLLSFLFSFFLSLFFHPFSYSRRIELLFYLPISLLQCIPLRKFSYLRTPCWRTIQLRRKLTYLLGFETNVTNHTTGEPINYNILYLPSNLFQTKIHFLQYLILCLITILAYCYIIFYYTYLFLLID